MSTPTKKKKPNKQHDVRGASLKRIAQGLRKKAQTFRKVEDPNGINLPVSVALDAVAMQFEAESKTVSALR